MDIEKIKVGDVIHDIRDAGALREIEGKGLSTNDYTNADKSKLEGIEANAQKNKIESINVNGSDVTPDSNKAVNLSVPTKMSDLNLDGGNMASGASLRFKNASSSMVIQPFGIVKESNNQSHLISFPDRGGTVALTSDIPDVSSKQDTIQDLSEIRSGAALGATAYQKPSAGIPASDMTSAVQNSLQLADSSVQAEPIGSIIPPVNPSEFATKEEVSQLAQELYGINEVLLDGVTTAPGRLYISADMVSPGDTLVFELTSINNLVGLLKAEKTGYEHDAYIDCPAGQSVTRTYVVPEGFLRIYTAGNYNPMVVTCRRVRAGKIQNLEDDVQNLSDNLDALSESALKSTDLLSDAGSSTSKGMTQKAITNLTDSPFAVVVPDALRGIVSFRMSKVAGLTDPDTVVQFRVSSVYRGGAWHLYMKIQKTTDGTTWTNYDAIEILSADAPSPLPTIEEVKSKYGAFTTIINWPLMGNISQGSASYILKKGAPNYFARKLQEQINEINLWPTWGDYELKDRTKQIIKVDINGNGDYTSIAAAYAAITDSSYNNQYEVVVYPGTYNEYNLIPPKFTHTHGLIPNSVIVTSEGVSSTLPVFDQRVPCKLSNMKIVSGTGYCVHQDQSSLNGIVLVNENLHCKKVYGQDVSNFKFRTITNPAVLGIGSHLYGAKFIWDNCVFEDGQVASHTVGGSDTIPANQHLIYRNCKLVNAYIHLLVTGASSKVGNFVCEIDGLYTEKGRPSVVCQLGARSTGDTTYNFPWQIIGGGNRDFVAITLNSSDALTDDVWPNINTNDVTLVQLASGVSVTKGQFVDISGNVCNASTPSEDVIGMALEDAAAGETVKVCTGSFPFNNNFNSFSFPYTPNDGDYGIGSDGRLLRNAATVIGYVKYNNFYRK